MLEAVRLYKEQGKYGGIDWERVAKHMDYTRSKQNCKNKYRRYRANQVVENKIEFRYSTVAVAVIEKNHFFRGKLESV